MDQDNQHNGEIRYDPVPGFRPVFFTVMIIASLYLGYVFFLAGASSGH
jgi:hypothetical protein